MKTLRYTAAAATILMSLMNLPIAFNDGDMDLPKALAWLISLLGVIGIAAAIGLILGTSWGTPALIAVGVVNVIGALIALSADSEGAVIGLTVSTIMTVLGGAYAWVKMTRAPQTS